MKNLLFIGPRFYNYHVYIKNGFEKAGYHVDYFDDRPSTSFLSKALLRLNKNLIKKQIRKYFDSILLETSKKHYDVVFVLYGQSFSKEMMEEMRSKMNDTRFIFYMYDPIFSMPDRLEFAKVFDKCYSFDSDDCKKYPIFHFLPLFYSNEIKKQELVYDSSYVGTIMPGKYAYINNMLTQLKSHYDNIYELKVIQSPLVWLYYKLTKKEFRKSKMKEFTYSRISNQEADEIMAKSRFILDCPKKNQSGLTIRCFEALEANKKLITTNQAIKEYDFYNPNNIYIFEDKFDFEDAFFKNEYQEVPVEIKEKYSLDNWIKQILEK